jgi:carbohydrate-selective porin OprB
MTINSSETSLAANYGFGLSADQEIIEGVTLFARYGSQRGSVSEVEHAWSAGLGITGKFFGRDEDTVGLAYGQAIMGKDWKSLDEDTGRDSGGERRLEIYYSIKAGNYLKISPNMQLVKNPLGDKGNNSAWALGVRAHFNLSKGFRN